MSPCPACRGPLAARPDGSAVCEDCGGLWRETLDVSGLSLVTDPKSKAFATTLRCPQCEGVLVPWQVGTAVQGYVHRCASCGQDFVEAALARNLDRLQRQSRAQRAYETLADDEKVAIRSALAASEEHGEEPPPFRSGLLFRLIGLPQVHLTRVRVPVVTPLLAIALIVAHFAVDPSEWFYRADDGDYLAAVTSIFVHVDGWHLLGNLYFLVVFGTAAESKLPRPLYAVWLLVGGTVAALVEGAVHPSVPVLGASGAVAVALGVCFVLLRSTPVTLPVLMLPLRVPMLAFGVIEVLYQAGSALIDRPGVAWFAHLVGIAAGVVLAFVAGDPRGSPQDVASDA